jgi:hypothetical protein
MTITCNLHDQWVESIRSAFRTNGVDPSAFDDRECSLRWISWQRRFVEIGKRQIHQARNFSCPPSMQPGLMQLDAAVRNGDPLWQWQSKLIDRQNYEDGMLNDFGILHFHLGENFDPDGYIERTGELLFAVVAKDHFYELGVFDHTSWHELDLLEIIETNWPSLLTPFTIPVLSVSSTPKTKEDVRLLRKANINSSFTLQSGRIILPPGGGQASDGTSAEAVMNAMRWSKRFRQFEKTIREEIKKRVAESQLEDRDYTVVLELGPNEISASIPGILRWVLWKKEKDNQ